MQLKSAQRLIVAERRKRAVSTHCGIGQSNRAVTSDTVAAEEVGTDVNFLLEKVPTGIEAATAADAGIVEGTERGSCGRSATRQSRGLQHARKCTVAELANHSKNLIVSESGFEGSLENQI